MATGLRILGYADLEMAFGFIRNCEAEGNEGVSPETYGTRPANGTFRAPLSIQERDLGYLSEDELIDAIDARANGDDDAADDDAADDDAAVDDDAAADDDAEEYIADLGRTTTEDEPDDDVRFAGRSIVAADVEDGLPQAIQAPVARVADLPARIGSRRELYRLGVDTFNSRARLQTVTWKETTRQRKQFLRHLERLLKEMFPDT